MSSVCEGVCVYVWQKQKKTYVILVQCLSDNGPQLTNALTGTGNDALRDKALQQLAVVVENVVFELTEIPVYAALVAVLVRALLYHTQ